MIKLYSTRAGLLQEAEFGSGAAFPADAVWIDLLTPTVEEEQAIERALGINIPVREELAEIEASSRLYVRNGATFMTATVISRADNAGQHHVEHDEVGPVRLEPREASALGPSPTSWTSQAVALQVRRERPPGPSARRRRRAPADRRTAVTAGDSTPAPPAPSHRARVSRWFRGVQARWCGCGRTVSPWPSRPSPRRTAPSRRRPRPVPRSRLSTAPSPASSLPASPSASASWCAGSPGLGPSLISAVGTRVHRSVRGVVEGPRGAAVRHQRQGRPRHRHRGRVDRPRRRARQGLGPPLVGRGRRLRRLRGDRPVVVPREPARLDRDRRGRRVLSTAAGIGTLFGLLWLLRAGRVARGWSRRRRPITRRAGCSSPPPARSPCSPPAPPWPASASGAVTSSSRPAPHTDLPAPGGVDTAARAVRPVPRRPRAVAVHHAERGLLSDRHRAHRPPGRRRGLDADDQRPRRERGLVHLRRARGDGRLRGDGHVAVRLQRGRRQPRRQRDVAGRAAEDAAGQGRREGRCDADRRPLGRRLHRRVPDRGRASTVARRWSRWR